ARKGYRCAQGGNSALPAHGERGGVCGRRPCRPRRRGHHCGAFQAVACGLVVRSTLNRAERVQDVAKNAILAGCRKYGDRRSEEAVSRAAVRTTQRCASDGSAEPVACCASRRTVRARSEER